MHRYYLYTAMHTICYILRSLTVDTSFFHIVRGSPILYSLHKCATCHKAGLSATALCEGLYMLVAQAAPGRAHS